MYVVDSAGLAELSNTSNPVAGNPANLAPVEYRAATGVARLTVPSGPYRAIVRGNATSVNFYAVSTLHQNGMGHDFFRVRLSSPQGNWVFKAFVTGPNIPNTRSAIDLVNGTNRFEISYSVLAENFFTM